MDEAGAPLRVFDPALEFRGPVVALRPLRPDDADALFAITPPGTFDYFLNWPRAWTRQAFAAWVAGFFSPTQRAYAVLDARDGRLLGGTSFLDIDAGNRSVEVGRTWYAPEVRGTLVNPACKLLLLGHAFEREGCVRVTLKCDARNLHSQRAIARLGAVREGTLRKHRVQQNGFVRDTVYFGVTRDEWPEVKDRLERRLGAGGP